MAQLNGNRAGKTEESDLKRGVVSHHGGSDKQQDFSRELISIRSTAARNTPASKSFILSLG